MTQPFPVAASESRRTETHAAGLVVAAAVTGAINFAYIVYAGRALGPAEYADFWAALSIVYAATLLLNPIAPFASHYAAAAGDPAALHPFRHSVVKWLLWLGGGILVVAVAGVRPVARALNFRSPMTLLAATATVAVYGFLVLDRGLSQGLRHFRRYNVNILIESLSRIALAAVALAIARSAWAPLLAYFFSVCIAELLLLIHRPRPESRAIPLPDAGPIAVQMFLLMLGLCVFQNADTFAVKRWLPLISGDYAAAAVLSRTVTALAVPLYVLLIPSIAGERDERRAMKIAMRISLEFLALASVLLLLFAGFAPAICRVLFGRQFSGASSIVLPLAGLMTVVNSTLLLTQTLISTGRSRILFFYVLAAAGEVAALAIVHDTVWSVLSVLYGVNLILLVVVIAAFALRSRRAAA